MSAIICERYFLKQKHCPDFVSERIKPDAFIFTKKIAYYETY